jgi:LCP family protein required for cell wall assembly
VQGRGNSDDRPRRNPHRPVRRQDEARPDRSARYASGRRTTSEPGASGTARTRGAPRGSGARPTGRSDATGTGTARPTRIRPPVATLDPKPRRTVKQRFQLVLVVASVLVMVLTGTAWGLYRDITAGITTTNVIAGGDDDDADNILLVGVDSRTDAQGNPLPPALQRLLSSGPDSGVLNSDTIILLHVPKGGGAAVAFSIPRDSYVNIPGYQRDKINAAYPATKALAAEQLVAEGVTDPKQVDAESSQKGRSTLIETVEDLTGLHVDHYAEINLLGFYNLTEAIGGIDVCLKAAVNDPLSGARFQAGPQTISGAAALAFVRQRHGLPEGDMSRIRRQQVFLAAVADKILSSGTLTNPSKLSSLIGAAQQALVIDSGWDLLSFARQASDIAAGNLEFLTIPTTGTESNARGDVVLVDPAQVKTFVDQRIEEQQRAAEEEQKAPPLPPARVDVIASRYVVDVQNGSNLTGMAAAVARRMRELGFVSGTVDNTGPTPTSVVRYTGSDREAAQAVADQLGGIPVQSEGGVTPGHLAVLLGADFNPATLPAASDDARARPVAAPSGSAAPITAAGVPCVD